MRAAPALVALVLAATADAQAPVVATAAFDPARNFVAVTPTTLPIPLGPVAFPLQVVLPVGGRGSANALLDRAVSPTEEVQSIAAGVGFSGAFGASEVHCHLSSLVSMPLPARIPVRIAPSFSSPATFSSFSTSYELAVDVGGDGSFEYSAAYSGWPGNAPAPPPAVLDVLVDARGTLVDWESTTTVAGIPATSQSLLELHFAAPVQEPGYGSACGGEFGCQRVAGTPYARTLVASFPANSTFAWFVGGDQQQNVLFPGISCPLLCNLAVVLSMPLQTGPNGRQMAVLDTLLPPLPGQTWFAQGVAISGNAFVGTNGVRITTP